METLKIVNFNHTRKTGSFVRVSKLNQVQKIQDK